MHGTGRPLEGLLRISPGPAFGLGQMSRSLARFLWADAEETLQREHSQQTPSVYVFISNEDLALAFLRGSWATRV